MGDKPAVLLMRPQGEGPGPFDKQLRTVYVPVLAVRVLEDGVRRVLELLEEADWLVLTSPRGAAVIAPHLAGAEKRPCIAAVGPVTATTLREYGLEPCLVPGKYRGEDLARELLPRRPRHVVMARSEKALPEPAEILRRHGVKVDDIPVYTLEPDNIMAKAAARTAQLVDYVAFTSPLIARVFTQAYREEGHDPSNPPFRPAAIGPTTASQLLQLGYPQPLTPPKYTLHDLARTILEDWRKRQNPTHTG